MYHVAVFCNVAYEKMQVFTHIQIYLQFCTSYCHACVHSVAMCGWLLSFPPTQQSLVPKFTLLLSVYILIFEIWTFYLLSWSSLSTSLECIMHIVRHTYILANSGTPASGTYDWFRDYVIVRSQISNFQHLKGIEKYTWGILPWCDAPAKFVPDYDPSDPLSFLSTV